MFVVCFWFLLCLGCSFVIVGDTYVVHWLGGSCWFVGSWVAGYVCLPGVCALGPWGCNSTYSCFFTALVLVVLFCLIRPCRIGVQRWWLEILFFLSFWIIIISWGRLTVFIPCTDESTCSCVIFHVCRGRYLLFYEILLVLQSYHERK
jgi:hypothetical protein